MRATGSGDIMRHTARVESVRSQVSRNCEVSRIGVVNAADIIQVVTSVRQVTKICKKIVSRIEEICLIFWPRYYVISILNSTVP